jgi:membrane protein
MRISPELRSRLSAPTRVLLAPAGPVSSWLERVVGLQLVDRGAALGAQAFGALIPLMIVYGSVVPLVDSHRFSNDLIRRLKLSGATATTISQTIAPTNQVAHSVTVLSFVLVIVSALSFARAVQRLYEHTYELAASGIRGTPWHLLWIALIPIYITIRPPLSSLGGTIVHIVISLAIGAVAWLATPYILLGRRVAWRRLVPGAVVTAASMTILGIVSLVYLPRSLTSSASQFGAIGVAVAVLSWLMVAGFVLVGSAAAGAVALEWVEHRQ